MATGRNRDKTARFVHSFVHTETIRNAIEKNRMVGELYETA